MLITNFASGELSETLFGRTDLGQYYSGASRLENFDVIPTGGIKRRGGMEQLKELDGEGRIIPFVINRNNAFLLYLSSKRILSYRLENEEVVTVKDHPAGGLRFYETPEHIREVQYAQNFDTMILCHEEYPPLEVRLESDNQLSISSMAINNEVKIKATNMSEEEVKQKYQNRILDKKYAVEGYLRSEKNYPRCGTFYNGRLIFAGTKNNPQRVFASKVLTDDDRKKRTYPFSTYGFFATKQRKYIIVRGLVQASSNTITVEDDETPLAFTEKLSEYVLESSFFESATGQEIRIEEMSGGNIKVSGKSNIRPPLNDIELSQLENWKKSAYNAMAGLENKENAFHMASSWDYPSGTNSKLNLRTTCAVTRLRAFCFSEDKFEWDIDEKLRYYDISPYQAQQVLKLCKNIKDSSDNGIIYLRQEFQPWVDRIKDKHFYYNRLTVSVEAVREIARQIITYMQYKVRTKEFFGDTPSDIYNKGNQVRASALLML